MNMSSYSCCTGDTKSCQDIKSFSALLKLVGEENRLRLLCILKDGGEHCVCEFNGHLGELSQSLISHHLADLKDAGLINSRKQGLKMYYALTEYGTHIVKAIFALTVEAKEII